MWNEVKSQNDADALMELFGGFHDGCIKEMKYISGEYVNEELSMNLFNSLRDLYVIFQHQNRNPSTIEVVFSRLIRMNLAPQDEQFDGIILGACIAVNEDCVIWVDDDWVKAENIGEALNEENTWIKAGEMKWRVADEYIGSEEVYINRLFL